MSEYKLKPTRWYYVMAILIPVFACMGTVLIVYGNVPKLPGALEALGVKNLTQVVVPGSAEIHFPKSGSISRNQVHMRFIMNTAVSSMG